LGGGPPRFPPDSPCPAVLGSTTTRAADRSPTGLSPPAAGLPRPFGSAPRRERDPAGSPIVSHNPDAATAAALARRRFGQSPFRSPLLRASRLLPLPRGTEMFQVPRFPPPAYGFSWRWPGMTRAGLPHSDTRGSRPVDGSPRLFAVPRVLHRLTLGWFGRTSVTAPQPRMRNACRLSHANGLASSDFARPQ
jgi:hypothetical protein